MFEIAKSNPKGIAEKWSNSFETTTKLLPVVTFNTYYCLPINYQHTRKNVISQ